MINKMVVANLVQRPMRSLISIVAVALEVTLILLIVGLLLGILQDSRSRQAGIGADVIVQVGGNMRTNAFEFEQLPHAHAVQCGSGGCDASR